MIIHLLIVILISISLIKIDNTTCTITSSLHWSPSSSFRSLVNTDPGIDCTHRSQRWSVDLGRVISSHPLISAASTTQVTCSSHGHWHLRVSVDKLQHYNLGNIFVEGPPVYIWFDNICKNDNVCRIPITCSRAGVMIGVSPPSNMFASFGPFTLEQY